MLQRSEASTITLSVLETSQAQPSTARNSRHLQGLPPEFGPLSSRLEKMYTDHFEENQFEPLILSKFGVKKVTTNATPSIFPHRKQPKPRKAPAQHVLATDYTLLSGFTPDCGSILLEDPTSQETVASLLKRIGQLEQSLETSERRRSLLQRQKDKAVREKASLKQHLSRYLTPDQLRSMEKPNMRGTPWAPTTIEKGLKLRLACATRGYNVVREMAAPLPAERTLQRHIENYKFSPGILHEMLPPLALKVGLMEEHERHAVLIVDEIQVTAGLGYDQATGIVIGKPTIPLADGTLLPDAMATHALVFM
ncbi:hypothetical protein HPB50_010793 [Hyalomma asiaticum]|uniref:Uncharacterized protein n=1 Tax=Hyalomma asiaticum TaxID=266040 RepID=A0ACB7TEH6_HYAAI|nr:hypothetical protein HPB50_010793 [Hyalomma asiaticum]